LVHGPNFLVLAAKQSAQGAEQARLLLVDAIGLGQSVGLDDRHKFSVTVAAAFWQGFRKNPRVSRDYGCLGRTMTQGSKSSSTEFKPGVGKSFCVFRSYK